MPGGLVLHLGPHIAECKTSQHTARRQDVVSVQNTCLQLKIGGGA